LGVAEARREIYYDLCFFTDQGVSLTMLFLFRTFRDLVDIFTGRRYFIICKSGDEFFRAPDDPTMDYVSKTSAEAVAKFITIYSKGQTETQVWRSR
jgi:hypothetical protein